MRREDFVFCIGFEGSTAIVDGRLLRLLRSASTRQLAEAGLYKQAVCSAVFGSSDNELSEILSIYNARTTSPIGTVEDLKRTFGVSGLPKE